MCPFKCMWSDLPVCKIVLSHDSMPQGAISCACNRITEGMKRKSMWQWATISFWSWWMHLDHEGQNQVLSDTKQIASTCYMKGSHIVLHSMRLMHSMGIGSGSFTTWLKGNAKESVLLFSVFWGSLESFKAQKCFNP